MSVLRYYKKIEQHELSPDDEVLEIIRNARGGKFIYQYIQCILAPVRNREKWTIHHSRILLMGWE